MTTILKYIEPVTNKAYYVFPSPWHSTLTGAWVCGLRGSNCEQFGWRVEREELPEDAPTYKWSKLKLIRNLKDVGVWSDVKAAIATAGYEDEWEAAQEIASDDPQFSSFFTALRELFPSVDFDAILESSILD